VDAVAGEGFRMFELPGGAGHDGIATIDITDIGMRCPHAFCCGWSKSLLSVYWG
jgi:hypothetical protein